jgi:hypothetical protein
MGQDAIEEKLDDQLSSTEPWTEMRVVYVLAEIRKHLELLRKKKMYPALNFHCCWALHAKARGLGAYRILKRFDEAHPYFNNWPTTPVPQDIVNEIGRTVSLEKFRADMKRFLKDQHLPLGVVDNTPQWLGFIAKYSSVTEDCPFILSAKTNVVLAHINSIAVKKLSSDSPATIPPGHQLIFQTQWQLLDKDKKELGVFFIPFTVKQPGNSSNRS